MNTPFKAVIECLKKETVLAVSGLLALFSCFLVKPDKEYLTYFSSNMGTIIVLFCLMAVVAGLSGLGVFRYVGEQLLERIQSERGIVFLLVFLCFFGSMFITNDVALITFVPFGIMILKMAGMTKRLCRVVTFMTIAANLGSMFTPMGNPQNLYLYSVSGMTLSAFLRLMLPHTAAAGILLYLCVFFGFGKEKTCVSITGQTKKPEISGTVCYLLLFLICLQTVGGVLPAPGLLMIIIAALMCRDRSLFRKVDYSLLLTFLFFFVFIGNMNRFLPFREFVVNMIAGHEKMAAIGISQVISNVPAALLLSNFTNQWALLIIGTNLGGLGTLIASMASLISYKQVAAEYPEKKGRYLAVFTWWNLLFLAALAGFTSACGL